MVVLTIVTSKNRETVYFDPPLPKVHFMKFLSCSLYNSWDTLKNEGSAGLVDSKRNPEEKFPNCPPVIMILIVWQKNNRSVLRVVIRWVSSRSKYPSWAVDDQ